jgi:raffinose/stachyose/melibiose transport system substrate-binding protein
MNKKKFLALTLSITLISGLLIGCGKTEPEAKPEAKTETTAEASKPSGEITVLTNRTDLVDTTFKDYASKFNETYPDVKVNFEAIADYEGQVKIRMNTKDYGDVLLVPNNLPMKELPNIFEPLGSVDELGSKYMYVNEKAIDKKVYGLAVVGNAQGIVYNKKVFENAGITTLPKTQEEFIADMKLIKEKLPEVTPLYTNYAAGWPLTQWESQIPSVSGDPESMNNLAKIDDPFAANQPHYVVYKLMYDLVKNKLVERDPLTSDWESSKVDLAKGKIGAMVLGSWVISQIQEKADNKSDIGYMPFPSNKDGKMFAGTGGDYKIGINVNSKNKTAARAWLDFFVNDSGFAVSQGGIPTIKGAALPENLSSFKDMGVVLVENNPAPLGEEGLVDKIDSQATVGLWQDNFKKRIIESALINTKEDFDAIMKDLNSKWKTARTSVTK